MEVDDIGTLLGGREKSPFACVPFFRRCVWYLVMNSATLSLSMILVGAAERSMTDRTRGESLVWRKVLTRRLRVGRLRGVKEIEEVSF